MVDHPPGTGKASGSNPDESMLLFAPPSLAVLAQSGKNVVKKRFGLPPVALAPAHSAFGLIRGAVATPSIVGKILLQLI